MKSNEKWFKVARSLVAEIREGDGVNPKLEKEKTLKRSRAHKNQQLSKTVMQVLSLVFQGETVEPVFSDLLVDRVDLNSESQFFEVTLRPCQMDGNSETVTETEVLHALTRAKGYLRTEVAHAINRKRVPKLRFKYLV